MSSTSMMALYWLAISLGFGLALLMLGIAAQAWSWLSQAWRELSEFDRSYSVSPASLRDDEDE